MSQNDQSRRIEQNSEWLDTIHRIRSATALLHFFFSMLSDASMMARDRATNREIMHALGDSRTEVIRKGREPAVAGSAGRLLDGLERVRRRFDQQDADVSGAGQRRDEVGS